MDINSVAMMWDEAAPKQRTDRTPEQQLGFYLACRYTLLTLRDQVTQLPPAQQGPAVLSLLNEAEAFVEKAAGRV
jgi:hypothetical protein